MNPWADETNVDLLKKLWKEGVSASGIAARIGGTTRNAVIGKVFRPKLQPRGTQFRNKNRVHLRKAKRPLHVPTRSAKILPSLVALPLPPREVTDIARVSFNDLDPHKHCRFIPVDIDDFKSDQPLYCGATPHPGPPYCGVHLRRCSQGVIAERPRNYIDHRLPSRNRPTVVADIRDFEVAER